MSLVPSGLSSSTTSTSMTVCGALTVTADRLRMLPEEFALAIELHDLEGFRYVDIANATGVPLGTVMSRPHRGRRLLQGALLEFAHRKGIVSGPPVVGRGGESEP